MRRYSLAELESLPTLCVGQADDLKIDTPIRQVWLSRCGIADGEPCENKVTVMVRRNDRWEEKEWYEAT
jgi:hypothetical protein